MMKAGVDSIWMVWSKAEKKYVHSSKGLVAWKTKGGAMSCARHRRDMPVLELRKIDTRNPIEVVDLHHLGIAREI